MFAFVVFNLVP